MSAFPAQAPSRDSGREARLEALLENLSGQVAQLAKAQEEDRRAPLSKPLLAGVDAVLAHVRPQTAVDREQLEQVRRVLRLGDCLQDPDDVVAATLPAIWQQLEAAPASTDNAVLVSAVERLPVTRNPRAGVFGGPLLAQSALGVRAVPSVQAPVSSGPSSAARGSEACYRCGRWTHNRAAECKATTFRTGEPIREGQKARFAPQEWKARYGFDSQGFSKRRGQDE